MLKEDIIIRVRFKTTAEGGRTEDIRPNNAVGFYGCPLFVDGAGFDCRIFLDGKTLRLGETYELPVKFLDADNALPKLSIGKDIVLWEGKDIATGKIIYVRKR
jgi:hypothetical protein